MRRSRQPCSLATFHTGILWRCSLSSGQTWGPTIFCPHLAEPQATVEALFAMKCMVMSLLRPRKLLRNFAKLGIIVAWSTLPRAPCMPLDISFARAQGREKFLTLLSKLDLSKQELAIFKNSGASPESLTWEEMMTEINNLVRN